MIRMVLTAALACMLSVGPVIAVGPAHGRPEAVSYSPDIGVMLSEEEMRGLLGGEGCFGLFGTWYGSANCCKEIGWVLFLGGIASKLTGATSTMGNVLLVVGAEAQLYAMIHC
jgi:hypothetical protein